jgi:Metal-dependent hydrolase
MSVMALIIIPSQFRTCDRWKPLPYVWSLVGGRSYSWRTIYHHCDPCFDTDLLECITGGTPVLLAGDLNAKHKDWNSRLDSQIGVLLREFPSTNSCIVHGPNSPTTIPSCPTVTPEVLDIVVVKDFVLPVNLTVCSAISSDHFPVTVDLRSRSYLQTLPDRPSLKRVDWTHFQDHLSDRLNGNPRVYSFVYIDARLDRLANAIHEAISASAQKSQTAKQPLVSILPMILVNIREKNRLRRQWQIDRDSATKNRVNRLQRWIAIELKEWRNTQWADTIESLNPEDQSSWKMTKRVMRIPGGGSSTLLSLFGTVVRCCYFHYIFKISETNLSSPALLLFKAVSSLETRSLMSVSAMFCKALCFYEKCVF